VRTAIEKEGVLGKGRWVICAARCCGVHYREENFASEAGKCVVFTCHVVSFDADGKN
jgi:hypothetical protein